MPPSLLDFEDAPAALELKLDLPNGERPERRISSPSLKAVTGSTVVPAPSAAPGSQRDSAPGPAAPSVPPGAGVGGRSSRPSPAAALDVPVTASRPRVSEPPSVRPAAPAAPPAPRPSERRITRELLPGAALIAASILVTLADQAYASNAGHVAAFGPVRIGWVAGVLMLAGVLLVIYRLLPKG